MHIRKNKEKGITMVTLAVTIIVLIILAGVSIHTLIGDNGIITKARQAKENIELAQVEEQTSLNQLYAGMTNEIEIGTEGEILESFIEFKRKIAQAITEKGIQTSETDSSDTMANNIRNLNTTDATIYEIEDEEGNKIPVPKGFYYVGGSLSSGVIISDNVEDEYDGKTDKTTWEYTTNLKGNQFVWIPCTTSEYKKKDWGVQNAEWDTTTPKSELIQIEKYGGFYVGRYEAGLANTIAEFTTNQTQNSGFNQIYNLEGIPQSRAGIVPWNFIDWTQAKSNAERMYNNQYVSSGLITGTQWDNILNTFLNKTVLTNDDMRNPNSWGNYMDSSIPYAGRIANADFNSTNANDWTLKPFGSTTTGITTSYFTYPSYADILTTGASSSTEKYHIFDIAGNVWEWTEECSKYSTSGQYRVVRGGSSIFPSELCPVYLRSGDMAITNTAFHTGFRVVLYIK